MKRLDMIIGQSNASGSHKGSKFTVNGQKYKVVNEIGYGAYAQVFKVTNSQDTICALKKYSKSKKASYESAKCEINSLLGCKHKNIIKMIDFELRKGKMIGQSSKIIIVLEYCNDNLINYIKRYIEMSLPFPESNIIHVLMDISSAMGYLHNLDPYIIHRDIKLDNVLIRNDDFVLCDFGSCTEGPIKFTQENQIQIIEEIACVTTPAYRCPEMLSINTYKSITAKADVWSLGCMIYFMCFLKAPFRQNINNALNGELFIPQSIFSKELIYIMCLALKSNPELRVSTFQFAFLVSKLAKEECRVKNKYNELEVDFPSDITIEKLINKPNGQIPKHRRNISAAGSIVSSPSKIGPLGQVDQSVFGEINYKLANAKISKEKSIPDSDGFKIPKNSVGSKNAMQEKDNASYSMSDARADAKIGSFMSPIKIIKTSQFTKHKKSESVVNIKAFIDSQAADKEQGT